VLLKKVIAERILEERKRRELPGDSGSGEDPREPLAQPLAESVWIEPYPDEVRRYRKSVELAYVAALLAASARRRALSRAGGAAGDSTPDR
jgi:hypothetical protein